MKLKFSYFTIFILFVSVDCGLVKKFFGNVKEDIHDVVDNTVNVIGKGTHKITEGLGLFLHRNEGNKFPGHQSGTVRPYNQLPNGNNIDNSNYYDPTNSKREDNTETGNKENHSQNNNPGQATPVNDNVYNKFPDRHSVTPTNQISNYDNKDNTNGSTHKKYEENTSAGVNGNNSQYYNPIQSTSATVEHTSVNENVHVQNGAHSEPTTEFNINKNEEYGTTTNKVKQPEATSNKNIHEHTTETIVTTTIVATTTETDDRLTGVELENILPVIKHNDTHFSENKKTVNVDTGSYTDTNELGTGENLLNNTNEESNKKAKLDESSITDSETNGDKANLLSDQMFFKDNKPNPKKSTHYICVKPLVRAANGDCLEPIEIDVRKQNVPRTFNIFQAEDCATGYARAQDNTCQKIIG